MQTLTTPPMPDYELIDSGDEEKLERYGAYILSRPDPQALWPKHMALQEWDKADGVFTREKQATWKLKSHVPERWLAEIGGVHFFIHPSAFKHTGVFPEQVPNWEWMRGLIEKWEMGNRKQKKIQVLNLFGYTGGASIACALQGAAVCHVDGSKVAINWAKRNADKNKQGLPIRWILDDALSFVKREIRREKCYDAIILDPPAFGHGPKGELWKIETHFVALLNECGKILSDRPLFFLINGYASGYSSICYAHNLDRIMKKYGGTIEFGEVTIEASHTRHLLPCGIFARWNS